MKDKTLIVKVDEEFTKKMDFLKQINGYKNRSETIRKTVDKEFTKETDFPCLHCGSFDKGKRLNPDECKYDY